METFPLEYVLHHVPLMAVFGLPIPDAAEYPSAPTAATTASAKTGIMSALLAKNSTSVWDAATSGAKITGSAGFFHVVAWPKNHALPPRKPALPPTTNRLVNPVTHSPLSPLNASSPLYPDGMMTPAWVRRHREEIPAVVLGFYDLPEAADRKDPLAAHASVAAERERDANMINEINERRLQRQLHEHAINYYREHGKRIKKKKAKLPATPIRPPAVNSPMAQSAPTLPGLPGSGSSFSMSSGSSPKPLNPMGWSVRYDYKMGVFAEFRQDLDSATRHYEGAYQALVDMFHSSLSGGLFAPGGGGGASTDVLQPFTARWAEARTLADSINLRICKLSLYTDAAVPALQQLHKHLHNFRGLPEFAANVSLESSAATTSAFGLGFLANVTGGGSFEYWAWASKQYRIFAELVKIATSKMGLKVPFPPPGSIPNSSMNNPSSAAQSLLNTISNTGMNVITGASCNMLASIILWLPGVRKNVFTNTKLRMGFVAAAGISGQQPFASALSSLTSSSTNSHMATALAEERQVDHGTLIIELLTKSYEQFKLHRAGRMTLYLASEIARTYEASGRHEMALTFFGRIKRTYRNENWPSIVRSILAMSVRCGKALGLRETVVECLVEMMGERMTADATERLRIWEEVMEVLKGEEKGWGSSVPRPDRLRVVVDMDSINGFLGCGVQFRKANAYVGVPAAFQISVWGDGRKSPPSGVRLSKIRVAFSDSQLDHVWTDDDGSGSSKVIAATGKAIWVDCSDVVQQEDMDPGDSALKSAPLVDVATSRKAWCAKADLEIPPGVRKVFESAIIPTESQDMKILTVSLVIETPGGVMSMFYKVGDRQEDTASIRVIRRQPNLSIKLKHQSPGLLDEIFPVVLEITNQESESIHVFADLEFKGSMVMGDGIDTTSQISLTSSQLAIMPSGAAETPSEATPEVPETRNSLCESKNNDLGFLAPGSSKSLSFYLRATKSPGERMLYVMILYRLSSEIPKTSQPDATIAMSAVSVDLFFRKSETLRIPFSIPFSGRFQSKPLSAPSLPRVLIDNHTPKKDGSCDDGGSVGLLSAAFRDLDTSRSEAWTIVGALKALGPWNLEVEGCDFVGSKRADGVAVEVNSITDNDSSNLHSGEWKSGHYSNFAYNVRVTRDVASNVDSVAVGSIVLKWRRAAVNSIAGANQSVWVHSVVKIPKLTLSQETVWAEADIPAHVTVGVPFSISYVLQNSSLMLIELATHVEPSDSFVYGGLRRSTFRLLPLACHVLRVANANEKGDDAGSVVEGEEVPVLVGGAGAAERDGGRNLSKSRENPFVIAPLEPAMKVAIISPKGHHLVGVLEIQAQDGAAPTAPQPKDAPHKNFGYFPKLAAAIPMASIRIDFSGVGESGGGPFEQSNYDDDADDIEAVVVALVARGWRVHVVTGHSRGAAAALVYCMRHPHVPRVLINMSGRYHMHDGFLKRFGEELVEEFKRTVSVVFYGVWNTEIRQFGKPVKVAVPVRVEVWKALDDRYRVQLPALPRCLSVLTTHGTNDDIIPFSDSAEFASQIQTHNLKLINGGDHNYSSDDARERLIQAVVDFLSTEDKSMHRFWRAHGQNRVKTVSGIKNFRDFGNYPVGNGKFVRGGVLFRAANPGNVDEDGVAAMRCLGVKRVFDLRSNQELLKDAPREIEGIVRTHNPVYPDVDFSPVALGMRWKFYTEGTEGFSKAYEQIMKAGRESFRAILSTVVEAGCEPFVVHCTAGKDRTGVFAAILLSFLGVEDDIIVRDYALTEALWLPSNEDLQKAADASAGRVSVEAIRLMMGAQAESMTKALAILRRVYGSAEGYLRTHLGLTDSQLSTLRDKLVENRDGVQPAKRVGVMAEEDIIKSFL
ncbi:hypothetical protein HK101_008161 [Irineochytrium annulatum]|nr:hypothetical protein HK101_008161 [Irineochytrium annulatum]